MTSKIRSAISIALAVAGWAGLAGNGFGAERSAPAGANRAASSPRLFKVPKAIVKGFRSPRPDPADIATGERLFLETRFAQFFFAHARDDANGTLPAGDPVLTTSATAAGRPLPGHFAGSSINCRTCHLVGEHRDAGRGNRTYADFARRSPVPVRPDGRTLTPRNSPPMVNALIPREGESFLHFDGEFTSIEDLVKGTLTGRNFGWLPAEHDQAVRHIARIIRRDDGRGPLAREFGGHSYRTVFLGDDPALGEESERFRLAEEYRFDVVTASDGQVLDAIAKLIGVYANSLFFSRDESAEYDGSPYDAFLETNRLPRKADSGMASDYYNRHLAAMITGPWEPVWVSGSNGVAPPAPGRFKTLTQAFRFGPEELAGMKIFFARAGRTADGAARSAGNIGNCAVCHRAPDFTDFGFHNTGVAQEEYDALHGAGAFARLEIPGLAERTGRPDAYLPPSAAHPRAAGPFLDIPVAGKSGLTDLGLWNVFANPDQRQAQATLRALLQADGRPVSDADLLPRTVALFKTPSLRGLAFSDPYLHNGSKDTLDDVIRFYIRMSALARAGRLRNAAPELAGIALTEDDVAPLAAFLRSLNEDYE